MLKLNAQTNQWMLNTSQTENGQIAQKSVMNSHEFKQQQAPANTSCSDKLPQLLIKQNIFTLQEIEKMSPTNKNWSIQW